MALVYGDRVQESFTTAGTGAVFLGGGVTGYQTFSSVLHDGDTCYYSASDGVNWEVGLGTYAISNNTLARTSILSSSNGGLAVSWLAGTKNIWIDLPAFVAGTILGTTGDISNTTVIPTGGTSLQIIKNLFADNIFDLKSLGLSSGNDITDYTALTNALTDCAAVGARVNGNGMNLTLGGGQFTPNVNIDMFNVQFTCPDNLVGTFNPSGTLGTEYTAASISADFLSLTFSSAPAIVAGARIQVRSLDDFANDGNHYYMQQQAVVSSVTNSGLTLNFIAPLRYGFATTIKVCQMNMIKLRLQNCSFIGDPSLNDNTLVSPYLIDNPIFIDCWGQYAAEACFAPSKCYGGVAIGVRGYDGNSAGDRYVISVINGCDSFKVLSAHGRNVRHVCTAGSTTGNNVLAGINYNCSYTHLTGEDLYSAILDQHPPCDMTYGGDIKGTFAAVPESYEFITLQGARCIVESAQCLDAVGSAMWQPYSTLSGDYCSMNAVMGGQQSVGSSSKPIFIVDVRKPSGDIEYVNLSGGGLALSTNGVGVNIQNVASTANIKRVHSEVYLKAATHAVLIATTSPGTGTINDVQLSGHMESTSTTTEAVQISAGNGAGAIDHVHVSGRVKGGDYGVRNVLNTGSTQATNVFIGLANITGFATAATLGTISDGTLLYTGGPLGTPSSGVGTNLTGTAAALNIGGNAATVTTNANLTGPVTSTGNATAIANGAISNAMLANSAVANLSGTNTGDQTNISGNAATVTTNANSTGDVTSVGNTTTVAAVGGNQVAGFRNALLNGAMDLWQRGTSFTIAATTTTLTADRWVARRAGTGLTVSQQTSTPPAGFTNYTRIQRNSATTSANTPIFCQMIETADAIKWAGKTVTLSFYARCGANYSAASSLFTAHIETGTGTNEDLSLQAYTGRAVPLNQTATLTTSFQRFSYTATLGATITEFGPLFIWTPVGTAGAADYVDICGVQIEGGSVATPFEFMPLSVLLPLARRYYRKTFALATAPVQNVGSVVGSIMLKNPIALGDPSEYIPFDPPMYAAPTFTTFNPSAGNANWRDITAGADVTVSVDPGSGLGSTGVLLATSGTVATLGDILAIHYTASAEIAGV